MVDKEERFCIFKENFDTTITEIEGPKYMTRAEAVERMAKAIFTEIWGLPNNRFDLAKDSVIRRNRKLAEAALDALLG